MNIPALEKLESQYPWNGESGRSLVSIIYLGMHVSGNPGQVHGRMLATMLDDGLTSCDYPAMLNMRPRRHED
jgi:hypothetical protein